MFEVFDLFEYRVWMIQLCSLLLISIAFIIMLKNEYSKLMAGTSVMICFGIYCQQSPNIRITSASTRFLILVLLLSSVIIYNYYTSGIVSVLVKNNYETNIKSKEDLTASSLSVGFSDSVIIKSLINVSLP